MQQPGRPRVRLRDVAERAGVSPTTASFVLGGRDMRISEETRQRVLRTARELDYRPNLTARSLRTQDSRTIGLVADTIVSGHYGGELIRGSHDRGPQARSPSPRVRLRGGPEPAGSARRGPRRSPGRRPGRRHQLARPGVGTARVRRPSRRAPQLPQRRAVPRDRPGRGGRGGRAAAGLLVGAGHRRGIWLVGETPESSLPGTGRYEGIVAELAGAGAGLDEQLSCKWWPEAAYDVTSQALAGGARPRAVVCLNDRIAFGVYQALAEAGLAVPPRRVGGVLRRLRAGQLAAALPVEHRVAAVRDGSPRRGGAARHGGASRRAPRAHAGAGPRLDRHHRRCDPDHMRLPCRGVLRVYLERGPTPTGGPTCASASPVSPAQGETLVAATPTTAGQLPGPRLRGRGRARVRAPRPTSPTARSRPPASGSTDAEEVWSSDVVVKVNAPTPDEIWRLRRRRHRDLADGPGPQPQARRAAPGAAGHRPGDGRGARASPAPRRWTCSPRWPTSPATARSIEAAHAFGRQFTGQVTAAGKVPPGPGLRGRRRRRRAWPRSVPPGRWARSCAPSTCAPRSPSRSSRWAREFVTVDMEQEVSSDGYAKEMTAEQEAATAAMYDEEARNADIVITTALIPGRPAPRLITAETVAGDAHRLGDRRHGRGQRRQRRADPHRREGRHRQPASRSWATPTSPAGWPRRPASSTAPTWSTSSSC